MNKKFATWMENRQYKSILKALQHPDYYARKIEDIEKETQLSKEDILKCIKNKNVNKFTFQNDDYIGLPERKKAYDEDKEKGINPYEKNYKGDAYRKKVLKGKSRF